MSFNRFLYGTIRAVSGLAWGNIMNKNMIYFVMNK